MKIMSVDAPHDPREERVDGEGKDLISHNVNSRTLRQKVRFPNGRASSSDSGMSQPINNDETEGQNNKGKIVIGDFGFKFYLPEEGYGNGIGRRNRANPIRAAK